MNNSIVMDLIISMSLIFIFYLYSKFDNKIDELQMQLKPLKQKYGELVDNVLPMLNKLGKEQYKTNNYILRIIRKGYERQSFQYKEGFNRALEKVNLST